MKNFDDGYFYEFQNLNFGESSPSILRRRTGNLSVSNFNLINKFQSISVLILQCDWLNSISYF